jgi:crotonobetainyl-CoA:carnitine CoA-transferase CaiB-like acyl-CoA transferase
MKPLQRYKILDLSRVLAGPFATQLLADLGADVLKIEPPKGDPTRGWGPPFESGENGESAYFLCANRGKKSAILDLDEPAHMAQLHELIRNADVLVENFLDTSATKLSLTWERLHAKYPKLILASVRGFASDVPAARRAGYDFIVQAESGWMSITGEAEGQPMKVGMALVDVLTALYLANGIQAALLHRERSGEAIHVEVPLMEAALAGLVNVASNTLITGQAPQRHGNAHPQIVPYETFPCANGEVALGVGSDAQFEVLALWLGLDIETHPHWRENRGRIEDREHLIATLREKLSAHTLDEIIAFCESHAIPAGRIRSVDDALFHQAGNLHQLIQTVFDSGANRMVPMLASPVLLNGERAFSKLPPPRWPRS